MLFTILLLACAPLAAQDFGFGAAARLESHFATDTGNDSAPALATNGNGVWIAAWTSSDDLGGTIGTDDDILYSRSTDNGSTWSAPAALNDFASSDNGSTFDLDVSLATDGNGTWIAVWRSNESFGGSIGTDYDLLYAVSTNDGASWSSAAVLNAAYASSDSDYDITPKIASDGGDSFMVVWESVYALSAGIGGDPEIFGIVSMNDGASWGAPFAVSSRAAIEAKSENDAVLASGGVGSGVWVVAWRSGDNLGGTIGDDLDMLYARTTDDGVNWSAVAALNPNAATDSLGDPGETSLAIACDGAGTWIASWDCGDLNVVPGEGTVAIRSTDDGASWSAAMPMLTSDPTTPGADRQQVVVHDNDSGEWAVVWQAARTSGFDLRLARSLDGGLTWQPDGEINSTLGGGVEQEAAVGVGQGGRWVVVWSSLDDLAGGSQSESDILFATSAALPVELSAFALD